MKIFRQIIATGDEWKPCCYCGKQFACGEIITSILCSNGVSVKSWLCSECFDEWFPYDPPAWLELPEIKDDYCLVMIDSNTQQLSPLSQKNKIVSNRLRNDIFKRVFTDFNK